MPKSKMQKGMRLNQIAMDIVKGGEREGEALRTVIVDCDKAQNLETRYRYRGDRSDRERDTDYTESSEEGFRGEYSESKPTLPNIERKFGHLD